MYNIICMDKCISCKLAIQIYIWLTEQSSDTWFDPYTQYAYIDTYIVHIHTHLHIHIYQCIYLCMYKYVLILYIMLYAYIRYSNMFDLNSSRKYVTVSVSTYLYIHYYCILYIHTHIHILRIYLSQTKSN